MNDFFKRKAIDFINKVKREGIDRLIEPYSAPEIMDEKLYDDFVVLLSKAINNAKENYDAGNCNSFIWGIYEYHNLQMKLKFNAKSLLENGEPAEFYICLFKKIF